MIAESSERRPACTGLTAAWCPVHGDCTCPDRLLAMDGPCPLHDAQSSHPLRRTVVARRVRVASTNPPEGS